MPQIFPFEMQIDSEAVIQLPVELMGTKIKRVSTSMWVDVLNPRRCWSTPGGAFLVEPVLNTK